MITLVERISLVIITSKVRYKGDDVTLVREDEK
jgi:hypothetical protein